jgi:hypothetical protein
MYSDNLHRRLEVALADPRARDELVSAIGTSPFSTHWYINGVTGDDTKNEGSSADRPFKTMARAFTAISSGDVIHLRGGVYENLTTPAGVTDVTIIGESTKPRHDHLTDAQKMGAAAWRTASGVTNQPLLIVRSQGWRIVNLLLAGPSAETCIQLLRDATYDSSHFSAIGCRFAGGKYAITNNGGAGFVGLYGNTFQTQSTASIACLTTAIAVPLIWDIQDNFFCYGSASHILSSASNWLIKNNVFALVAASALYIDLVANSAQGLSNVVTGNTLAGIYNESDYKASGTDLWVGNWVTAISTEAPNGFTILRPAAA